MRNRWLRRVGLWRAGSTAAVLCCVLLAACSGVPGKSTPGSAATAAYVWGNNYPIFDGGPQQTILTYSTASLQPSSPQATLTLPPSCNGGPIATDSSGQLYVACFSPTSASTVLVYPANSTGSATPLRTISVATSYYEILTMNVDSRGELYVAALDIEPPTTNNVEFTILVYSSDANGQATPVRTIQLPVDDGLMDFALDEVGNVYVAGYAIYGNTGNPESYVAVYSNDASASQPVRTINFVNFIDGVGVDGSGNVFVTAEQGNNTFTIEEFASGVTGYAAPTKTIPVPIPNGGAGGGPIRFDAAGNLFTVVVTGNLQQAAGVTLYDFGADGSGTPVPVAEVSPNMINRSFALN
jgi:hypothetical protein